MRALFVATVQSHIAQFHTGAISLLKENGYEIHVAAKNNLKEKNGLTLQEIDEIFDIPFERSPFSLKNISAYNKLKEVINQENYDIIHCNTPVGGILARLAARKERKKGCAVIYTAHGFHFYKGAPKKNWLIFYPIEKTMSRFTDKLITINEEDFEIAKQNFLCPVYHVHGVGVKTQKYDKVSNEDSTLFRRQNGWEEDFLILCTGELNINKNQATIIRAMTTVIKRIPNAKLLLAGNGPNENNLRELISKLHLEKNVILLGYRTDLEYFTHAADLIVTASFREGMPLNVLEAMYCHKPVVASNNRGHKELILNGKTGYLLNPSSTEEFAEKIITLGYDKKKREKFGESAFQRVQKYTDISVKNELKKVYFEG